MRRRKSSPWAALAAWEAARFVAARFEAARLAAAKAEAALSRAATIEMEERRICQNLLGGAEKGEENLPWAASASARLEAARLAAARFAAAISAASERRRR